MKKEKKKAESKTSYVKITFGFGINKWGYPHTYKKGKGGSLHDAIVNLFRQRLRCPLDPKQREEVLEQLKRTFETVANDDYVHTDQRRGKREKFEKSE